MTTTKGPACSVCGCHASAIIHTDGDYYDHPFQLSLPPKQPAPDAGEWRVGSRWSHGVPNRKDGDHSYYRQIVTTDGERVYPAKTEAEMNTVAEQIVRDHRLATLVPELVKALREIAAYDDESANEHLRQRGSYSLFDEPGAVRAARAALAHAAEKGVKVNE